jgi:hypothetical protein
MDSIISLLLLVGFFYLMMKFGCGAHAHSGGCGHAGHRHRNEEQTPREEPRNAEIERTEERNIHERVA